MAALATFWGADARADGDSSVTVRELDPKTGAALQVEEHSLTYLDIGPIFSLVDAANITYAFGFEGSLIHYRHPTIPSFGYGLFLQAQLQNMKYLRTAAGVQAAVGPVGVELGLGARQGDGTYTSTVSAHVGVFLSTGYVFCAFRFSPVLFDIPTNENGYGFETAFSVGLKLPIAVQGRDPTGYAIQAAGHAW